MPNLIFVSMENWDEIWRRNQFFVAEFSRRYSNHKILFVGLPQNVTFGLRQGDFAPLRSSLQRKTLENPKTEQVMSNVHLLNTAKWMPNTLEAGRHFNEGIERRMIRQAAKQLGIEHPLLWLNPHSAVHMVGKMGESGVVYDITDDWTQLVQPDLDTRLTIAQDAELCRKADAVIVCSERLYELKREMTTDLTLIPNGVDAHHYAKVLDGTNPLPEIAKNWETPVYGYTGTIHSDRVDVALVEQMAQQMTRGTFALVGPNMLSEEDKKRLTDTGRVVLTGGVPYRDLPEIMRAFTVCMTPHLVTPFTESLNPIKLWEYLAAGKPIVSTPVAGFRDYPQFVTCATGAKAFLVALKNAESEPAERQEARRTEARKHSWQSRMDQVERVIEPYIYQETAPAVVRKKTVSLL